MKWLFSLWLYIFIIPLILFPNYSDCQIVNSKIVDTIYAKTLFEQGISLKLERKYNEALDKIDSARIIYENYPSQKYIEIVKSNIEMGRLKATLNMNNEAITFYEAVLNLCKNASDTSNFEYGIALHNLGACYYSLGDIQTAFDYFEKSIAVFKVQENLIGQSKLAEAYYNQALVLDDAGELEISLENKMLCLDIRNNIKEDSILIAKTMLSIGESYDQLNNSEKSLENKMAALEICKRISDTLSYEYALINKGLGSTYNDIGKYDLAIYHFNIALKLYRQKFGDMSIMSGTVYNSLGLMYEKLEDFHKSLDFKLKALASFSTNLPKDHYNLGIIYNNLGVTYSSLNINDKAIYYYNRANKIFEKHLGPTSYAVANTSNNLSILYLNENKIAEATYNAEKALKIFDEQARKVDFANALNNYGNILFINNQTNKAISTFIKCEKLIKELGSNFTIFKVDLYNSLGQCYLTINKIDSAEFYYKKAIDSLESFDEKNKFNHILPSEFTSNYQLSMIYTKKYRSDNIQKVKELANYYLNKTKKIVTRHREQKRRSKYNPLWESRYRAFYELFLEFHQVNKSKNSELLFESNEVAKSDDLFKSIISLNSLNFANIPKSLLEKEKEFRLELNRLEKLSNPLPTDTTSSLVNIATITSSIFNLKISYDSLIQTLEKDYPEYYRLKYDTKTISLKDIQQKLLHKEQSMLEYFVGDSSIFIFVVRTDTFEVVQVKKDFHLDSMVIQMQYGLYGYYGLASENRKDDIFKKSLNDFSQASHNIYQRVIAPVAHLLTPNLVIIPDGVLGYVPFEALIKSKPEKLNEIGTYSYMIKDHTISYNYSATLWNEMKGKKHKKEPSKPLIAFAPFYEGSYTVLDSTINLFVNTLTIGQDTTFIQDVVARKTYKPLPFSGIEAGTVSKLWQGDFFINSDATEQRFYNVAGDYHIVHLSTHGVADARQGDYSYLAFAEQKDSIENEFLYVRDIYNTQLNADLVFLSACETAQGELQRGEGIISLARAFTYAGTKSIITTLWQVDDIATKDISIDFYKNLKKGFSKDVALRKSKLSHIKSAKRAQKHPFFWAAMIGIGDMGQFKN